MSEARDLVGKWMIVTAANTGIGRVTAEASGVHGYSLHPGGVASDVWRNVPWPLRPLVNFFLISNEEGALATLHCATSPQVTAGQDGAYHDERKEKQPSAWRATRRWPARCGT